MIKLIRERWKIIEKHPDYAVSDYGRIKRLTLGINYRSPGIRKLNHRSGYPTCGLWTNGKCTWYSVHRLVLEAFVGPCPDGKECNHKDDNRKNNFVGNLEWITHAENGKHAFDIGLR